MGRKISPLALAQKINFFRSLSPLLEEQFFLIPFLVASRLWRSAPNRENRGFPLLAPLTPSLIASGIRFAVTPFLEVKFFEDFSTGLTRVGLTYFLYNGRFARGGGRTHDLSLMKRLLYH
jgi:hypothetical protein